jgi:3-phosphoglycerate kinase
MAKRDNKTQQTKSGTTTTSEPKSASSPMEQRLAAFAEQLGRMAGTIHAKAESWMEGDTLRKQIASVRDGAAQLLDQLRDGTTTVTHKQSATVATRQQNKGRSGGVVDAPGKKHRKPAAAGAVAKVVNSQAAKLRTAKTMVKTNRRRGRA